MNSEDNKPVAPVLLAEKFATAARMEDTRFAEQLEEVPRLRELLLAIQWFSFQPGGIAKLVNDVVAAVPGRIVDLEIKKVGLPGKDGQWTLEQTLAAWKLQHRVARSWRMDYWRIRGKSVYYRDDLEPAKPTDCPAPECGFEEWIGLCFDPELTADKVNRGTGCDRGIIMEGFRRFNYAYFHGDCLTVVAERLPGYLRDICTLPHININVGPSWFPDVIEVLLDFMDKHAANVKLTVAETGITKVVADALDDTWEANGLARITGRTGFGKTAKVTAHCRAYPGRWRMTEAPLGDSLPDLIMAVGKSLGMVFPFGRLGPGDCQKVEFVLAQFRIGIVIDEAHRLCPQQFNRNSIAERYNWVRWAIVDHKFPCALVVTFQTDKMETGEEREKRFKNATGFNMGQFERRITMEKRLPGLLCREDFEAVARYHCGSLNQDTLAPLIDTAMAAPGGLGVIERVKLRAIKLAARRGDSVVLMEDFNAAIGEVPGVPARPGLAASLSVSGGDSDRPAKPGRKRRRSSAEVVQTLRPGESQADFGVSRLASVPFGRALSDPVLEPV